MKTDIILAGVGGQGILTIATILGAAALKENLYLKQAEVHGMSQRGGDVQSGLRLSNTEIHSDMVPCGQTDLIIAMEPMEALRYVDTLQKDGWVITSSNPLKNIPDYPEESAIADALKALPHIVALETETLAKQHNMPKCANMILLGMAAPYLELVTTDQLRQSIAIVFAAKGEKVIEMNKQAFDMGLNAASNTKQQ